MAISIQPATKDDVEALSRLQLAAFSSDDAWQRIFKDADPEDNLRLAIKQNLDMLTRPWRTVTKAVREEDYDGGEPIALCIDALYDANAEDQKEPDPELPKGANVELAEAFFSIFEECHKEAKEREGRFYHLTVLAVSPAVQRSGAGKAFMQALVDKCDAADLPCYLESTAAGEALYAKYGFAPYRGRVQCPLDEKMTALPMRRPAKSEATAE